MFKKSPILILLFFAISSAFFANTVSSRESARNCTCVTELEEEFSRENYDMSIEYRQKHNSTLKLSNESEFLKGTSTDQVVILIHGFMASPHEVKELAVKLNNIGYSVYMPLLYGFGSTVKTANVGSLEKWREQIKKAVQSLSHCYKKISIGGISLGGALATDFVLNNQSENITSLILLSPYYDVSQSVAKLLIGPLVTVKNSLDISSLFSLSHSPDLIQIVKNQTFYSEGMPFLALKEIFKLSDELLARKADRLHSIPVFVATSEADETIDLKKAIMLPQTHFKNITYFNIEKKFNVPHQISYEESNPRFRDMANKISGTIRKGQYLFDVK